jgi:uncharacterized protein YndB with AHSA1/START domain
MATLAPVVWKLHLTSPPEQVYATIATDEGRAKFWPETSVERDGLMTFTFLSEPKPFTFKVVEKSPSYRFVCHYFGDTTVTFELQSDGRGGTDLMLTETGFPTEMHRQENETGWISVLMNLKAVVDFGVDLRNHDSARTWAQGYCDN